jgi:thiamine kinase-like enzyme
VASQEHGCGIYDYIEGEAITPPAIAHADIQQAAEFVVDLQTLSNVIDSHLLPSASEACFSVQDILENIESRRKTLLSVQGLSRTENLLCDFLVQEFSPALSELTIWAESKLMGSGEGRPAELLYHHRTLSPSDFGFHNALRMDDGQIVFLDFEYFGWDDPAKMIADFLLHPGMQLGENHRAAFMQALLALFGKDKALRDRLKIYYPLLALTWCLILLNEFDPKHRQRRAFSEGNDNAIEEIQNRQLNKAKRMLSSVMREYEHFEPFSTEN